MSIQTEGQSTTAAGSEESLADSQVEETNESASSQAEDETADESDASEEESEDQQDQDGDDSDDDSEEKAKGEKPKKLKGFKKRIDKLNKRLSAKEQETEYWKQEALKRAKLDSSEAESASKSKAIVFEGKPNPDQYETHEDYLDALTDWKVDQRLKAEREKERQTKTKSEHETRISEFQKKVAEFRDRTEDFDDVIEDVDDIKMSLTVQEALLTSDLGPQLMYELAKNRDEYERICSLSPTRAAIEIGKIEARLTKSSHAPREIKKTSAPPPVKTVGSNGSSVKKSIFDKNLSFADYERIRLQELKAKGK